MSTHSPKETPIDAHLRSPAGEAVRSAVRNLQDEVPSLVWRSRLNEQLEAEQRARRRRVTLRWWRRGAWVSAGAATALLLWNVVQLPTNPAAIPSGGVKSTTVEAILVAVHRENTSSMDVSTATAGSVPEAEDVGTRTVPVNWSQEDLESL